MIDPEPDIGAVLVTSTYTVAENLQERFLTSMRALRLSRLRTGAIRLTGADAAIEHQAHALSDPAPQVAHLFPARVPEA